MESLDTLRHYVFFFSSVNINFNLALHAAVTALIITMFEISMMTVFVISRVCLCVCNCATAIDNECAYVDSCSDYCSSANKSDHRLLRTDWNQ